MSVLDNVYKTFSNLERDYKRSKKTRTDFIRDKFGGDISIGSMIILDALSAEVDTNNSADIERLSFIKDIFSAIKRNEDKLEQISSFSTFSGGDPMEELMDILNSADAHGCLQVEVSQAELHRLDKGTVHFACTPALTRYADLNKCKVLHAYNEHMAGMIARSVTADEGIDTGRYYQLRSRGKATPIRFVDIASCVK